MMECDVVSKYPQEIIDEFRVSQAEMLENDRGESVAFYAIRDRAIRAQMLALSKEFRKMAKKANELAERCAEMGASPIP